MNRSAINKALSKSLAYKAAGKHDHANYWAKVLMYLLTKEGINPDDAIATASQLDASTPRPRPSQPRPTFDSFFQS